MLTVKLSPAALRDLSEIANYIAKDNYPRSLTFTDELYDACASLTTNPLGHAARPDIGEDLRQKVHGKYLILFRVGPKVIRVERIIHGARDLKNMSFK